MTLTMKSRLFRIGKDLLILVLVFAISLLLCLQLSKLFDDNNPFATPVFILAVALVARFTNGHLFGILAAVLGVFCVNYAFTYPFFEFNLTISGYPLTFASMLLVSMTISALTTRIKQQEKLRYEAQTEKMRANLLRAVSHDIRTPLASIMGSSSALLDNPNLSPEDRKDLLDEINKDARWLVRMTENLLSVTKFSDSDVALRKTEEVVEEIVSSAIVKFHRNYPEMPVQVHRPEDILLAPMDATLIEQVLINLFENVVMHADTATRITLTISSQPGRVTIEVSDNGSGIPPLQLPRIFDGYPALHSTFVSDSRRNMGIGLSVCNSIIRAHGGKMKAYNNNEGGASFSFWLPCEEESNGTAS